MDRLERIEEELAALRKSASDLRRELDEIRDSVAVNARQVEAMLWQRGFPVLAHGNRTQLAVPPNLTAGRMTVFYNLMRRYSFRLFMRDLIQCPEGSGPAALTRYCSLKTVRSYLKALAGIGTVGLDPGGGYRLLRPVPSFGPTLEMHVCEIFRREFMTPALFNVRLQNTRHGGDYDVLAALSGRLAYVEVKSSPPRGVEHQAVSAFLDRFRELQPHVAVFFVDTELRMKDKIAPLFEEGLAREGLDRPVLRLVNEIFHIRHSIYLINSRKGIYTNLRVCFRDFFLWERKDPEKELF